MFSLAHWLFASYYWGCATRLYLLINDEDDLISQSQTSHSVLFWLLTFLNIAIPSVIGWDWAIPQKTSFNFYFHQTCLGFVILL